MQPNKPLVQSKCVKIHYVEPICSNSIDGILERLRLLMTTKAITSITINPTQIEYDCFEVRQSPFNPSSRIRT